MIQPERLRIIAPETEEQWGGYYLLRYDVLRKPWNQSFDSTKDDTEESSLHRIVLDEDGKIVGAGRLQFNSPVQAQVRSMAIHSSCQGKGVGKILLDHLEKTAAERGCTEVILDSRDYAIGFYEKCGYSTIAPSYLLFGIQASSTR
jgi:N-acetylglutamate synthase-like GNAT family acetyltransferase